MNQTIRYGLKQQHLDEIIEVASGYEDIDELILYGSRATGNYRKGSDVDLAIKGQLTTTKTADNLQWHLREETWLPYLFDVTNYNTIGLNELRQDIDNEGVLLYRRPSASTS